ncbi:MAG: thermonuclease family protein [Dehalococcoidia bacterium]
MARRRRSRRKLPPIVKTPFLRRRSNLWLVGALVLLGVAWLLSRLSGAGDEAAVPTPTAGALVSPVAGTPVPTATLLPSTSLRAGVAAPDISPDPALLERADVVHIVDGDTIDVRIDGREERVRYYGVDTTERGDDCFSEATDRNQALAGERVLLLPDARERDRYDRLLRYVFTEGGDSIEALLIAEGLGHAWRDDGAYRDTLVALEGEAEAAGVGCLWE